MRAHDVLATARMIVVRKAPYFASALLALVPREAPGLGTFGVTERMVMLWDPAFAEAHTPEEIAAVLVHELGHPLRVHPARCRALGAEPRLFNVAGDLEINDDVEEMGLKLPDGICCACREPFKGIKGMRHGLTAEEYYRILQDEQQKGGGQGRDGDGKPGDKPGPGWCGSGAGRPLPQEPAGGGADAGVEADGRSESDVERVRRETARAIQEQASKSRGSVPGGWVRWAEEALKPSVVPWQQKLARHLRAGVAYKAGVVDMTHAKLSRRQAGVGYGFGRPMLSAWHAPTPLVACGLDTSGSMGTAEVTRGLSEIAAILKTVNAEVEFCACDAEVHAKQVVARWQDLAKLVKGGGGTDFRPLFEAFSASRPRPNIVVFVTDGYGPAPEMPPAGYHTIWVLVGGNDKAPASWGDVVVIPAEER